MASKLIIMFFFVDWECSQAESVVAVAAFKIIYVEAATLY